MTREPTIQGPSGSIRETVRRHRRAVNHAALTRSLAGAFAVAGAVACVAAGAFAISGRGVPAGVYVACLPLLLALCAVLWIVNRRDDRQVAAAMYETFGFRDGVRPAYAIEGRATLDGFGVLQTGWARDRVEHADPGDLVRPLRKRLIAAAVALPAIAVLLGFAPGSEAVLAERTERAQTVALAEDLNEGSEELVEDEIASSDEEEAELLEPASLREMVDRLEVSAEKADLLRQYAEMEQRLTRDADGLEAPGLERLLDEAAAQLASSAETARLGEALEQRRLDDAARELEDFKLSKEIDAEKLVEKRREIDKLKSLAKRLAEAARKRDAQRDEERDKKRQPSSERSSNPASDPSSGKRNAQSGTDRSSSDRNSTGREGTARKGKSGEPGDESAEGTDGTADDESSLADEIRELEEAVEEAEESLGECQNGQCTATDLEQLRQSTNRSNRSLDRMSKTMRRSQSKRGAQQRLRSMSQKLSQCQSCVSGQCSSPFAGGKEAGTGSADSERLGNEREDGLQSDIAAAEKGAGPALTTLEAAESGDGVSSRKAATTRQDYDRQFEAFIERADVPAEVKEGVKVYLENIHKTPEPENDDDQ